MVNQEMLFIPDDGVGGPAVSLLKTISAVRLDRKENGIGVRLGLFSQLCSGTTLMVCGAGFDESTVKVWANGQCYFVFAQDIASLTNPIRQ